MIPTGIKKILEESYSNEDSRSPHPWEGGYEGEGANVPGLRRWADQESSEGTLRAVRALRVIKVGGNQSPDSRGRGGPGFTSSAASGNQVPRLPPKFRQGPSASGPRAEDDPDSATKQAQKLTKGKPSGYSPAH